MIKSLSICCLLLVFVSCKSTDLFQKEQNTKQHITLGFVGLNKDYLLDKSYMNSAVPLLTKPIKLQVTQIPFRKKTYQAFLKAKTYQSDKVSVHFIDSLDQKPHYLNLKVEDQVVLIEGLNHKSNTAVKAYLKSQPDASIVNQVAIAFNENDLVAINNADSVFLIETASKTYSIGLYEDGKHVKTINLSNGIVFNYNTSNVCWEANNHFKINISGFVNQNQKCPSKTYSTASRAERRINYYKL